MGNIAKIAALTALITLAFGITAIDVAMAEKKDLMAGATITGIEAKEVMVIRLYSDGMVTVEAGAGASVGPLTTGSADVSGNPKIEDAKQTGVTKQIGQVGEQIRMLWTEGSRCTWLVINGVWKYVCY